MRTARATPGRTTGTCAAASGSCGTRPSPTAAAARRGRSTSSSRIGAPMARARKTPAKRPAKARGAPRAGRAGGPRRAPPPPKNSLATPPDPHIREPAQGVGATDSGSGPRSPAAGEARMIRIGGEKRDLDGADLEGLEKLRRECGADIVRMTTLATCGHPGGSLSCLHLLLALYAPR